MQINRSYLRPIKAKDHEKMCSKFIERTDELTARTYPQAIVLPRMYHPSRVFGLGGVINSRGEFLKDTVCDSFGGYYPPPLLDVSDRKVIYLGPFLEQWGHFLIDTCARLWYVLQNIQDFASIDAFVFAGSIHRSIEIEGNFRELFELLGILDKIELVSVPTLFREVVVPEAAHRDYEYASPCFLKPFKKATSAALEAAKHDSHTYSPKIYLSRNHFWAAHNNEVNLEMLDDYFSRNGFEIIYPEELSLTECIRIIHNAKILASESGTIAHNAVFARQNCEQIIVDRIARNNHKQLAVDCARNSTTTYIDGNLAFYPSHVGVGPSLFYYSDQFAAFSADREFVPPSDKYLTNAYLIECLEEYLLKYEQKQSQGFDGKDQPKNLVREAYRESISVLKKRAVPIPSALRNLF